MADSGPEQDKTGGGIGFWQALFFRCEFWMVLVLAASLLFSFAVLADIITPDILAELARGAASQK